MANISSITLPGGSTYDLKDKNAQSKIIANGILKGDGAGGVITATLGTDYGTYSKPSGGIPASDLASGVVPNVEANPSGAATDTLTKLQVDQTIYAIDGIDYLTVVNGQICVVYEVTP